MSTGHFPDAVRVMIEDATAASYYRSAGTTGDPSRRSNAAIDAVQALLRHAAQVADALRAWATHDSTDAAAADRILNQFIVAALHLETARLACIGIPDPTRQPAARAEQGPPDAAALSAPTEPGGQ